MSKQLVNLEELLRVAHSLNPDKVDMEYWGHIANATSVEHSYDENNEDDGETYDIVLVKLPPCGTTACLLGHAALDEHFTKQGLAFRWRAAWDYTYKDGEEVGKAIKEFQAVLTLNGEGVHEDDRVELFGLPTGIMFKTADNRWMEPDDYLFMPYAYINAEHMHMKNHTLKEALIEHVTKMLDYIKSPETTSGWMTREDLGWQRSARLIEEDDDGFCTIADVSEVIPLAT